MNKGLKNVILKKFSFLETSGFVSKVKLSSPMFEGDDIVEEFYYLTDGVEIKLWYGQFVNGNLLTISISKTDENKCFSFDEYLLSKSYSEYKSFNNENDEDYISRIAGLFYKESKHELKDVLSSKKWIEVPKDYSRIR